MAKKILAAVDGPEHAWKALDLAADMAKQHGARLIVLHGARAKGLRDVVGRTAPRVSPPIRSSRWPVAKTST